MNTRRTACIAGTAFLAACAVVLPGCQLAGVMAASAERTGTKKVPAAYRGLQGHSFALVVHMDRSTLAENPNLLEHLVVNINARLAQHSGASGHIPSEQLVFFLMNNTRWPAMSNGELAAWLRVDRLVVLDLSDYRLTAPRNEYVWDGMAQGRVLAFEADGEGGGRIGFERDVRVAFPDQMGVSPSDLERAAVTSVLSRRLIDRVVWLFHDHEEPNAITY